MPALHYGLTGMTMFSGQVRNLLMVEEPKSRGLTEGGSGQKRVLPPVEAEAIHSAASENLDMLQTLFFP